MPSNTALYVCISLWLLFDLYVMSNIEKDLLHSQNCILTMLDEYEKSSEDVIASNYSTQLISLLEAIASLDQQKLQLCENNFKDLLTLKHIRSIA